MKATIINTTEVTHIQLKNAIGTDVLRPVMCGVHINFKAQRIEVTDAHVLMTYPIQVLENTLGVDGVIVPIDFFNINRYMVKLPKMSQKDKIFFLEYIFTDEYAEIYYLKRLIFRCYYIEGKFPNIDAVMPVFNAEEYNVNKLGFNSLFLRNLMNAFPKKFPNTVTCKLVQLNRGVIFESSDYYDSEEQDPRKIIGLVIPVLL